MSLARSALDGPGPLARRLYQRHTRLWHENVDTRTTPQQFTVLTELAERGELDHSTLAELSYLDKSTLAPVIGKLEGRGLVTLQTDERDRRRRLVKITQAGLATVRQLAPAAADVGGSLLRQLSPDDRATLVHLLRQVLNSE